MKLRHNSAAFRETCPRGLCVGRPAVASFYDVHAPAASLGRRQAPPLGDGVEVRRITVGGRMLGKSVRTLDLRKVYGINIIAVEHGQQTNVEFSADYTFKEGDTVAVIGKVAKIDKFEKEM